jgi:hypothetical protein
MAADEQSNLATPSQEAPKAAAAAEPEPSQLQEAGIEPAGWSQSETVAFQEAIEDLSLTQAAPIPPALPVAEISQTDEAAEAEPSYTRPTATRPTTRSRARGKETEVNAKTDWFSKLFRGDSQAAYRVVPEDDDRSDAQALPGTARDKPQAELQTESHTVESAAEAHAAPVEQVRVQETSASMPSTENSPGFVAETPETPAAAISAAESELRVADGGEALDIDPQAAKIQTASPHQAFENTLHPLTTEQVPAPAQHLELSERAAGGVTDQPEPPLALALDPSIHEAPKHGDSASEPLATVLPLQEQRPAAGLESLPSFPDAPPLRRVVDPARRRGPATWQQQTVDNPAALVAAGADLLPGGRGREGLSRSRLPNSSASAARGASAQRRAFAAGRAIEEPRAHQAAPSQQEGDGPAAAGSLSRRWRLLSHFEPTVADPAAQRSDEG